MAIDGATGLPINVCNSCKTEVIGYVDNPDETFYCDECASKCVFCGKILRDDDYENSCKECE